MSRSTPNHPFWGLAVNDYVPLQDLDVGTVLRTFGGGLEGPGHGGGVSGAATVLGLTWKPGEVEGYDIEVEGLHNFFVRGPGSDAPGVLVRNSTGSALRMPKSVGAAASITTTSRFKDSKYAVPLANGLCDAAQRDVDNLLGQLRAGNANPGLGTRALGDGFFELRGRNAGRVIVKQTSAGSFDIVGKFQGHVRGDKANSDTITRLISEFAGQ